MLTTSELQVLSGLVDVGLKSLGLAFFQGDNAATLTSALAKLEALAADAKTQDETNAALLPEA